jgi:hypothetical protein
MTKHSLYKYYTERRWADEFLDGKLLFRSLSYFRDIEDKNVREDQNEGNAIYRPTSGLVPTITEARVMRSIKITSRIKHLPVLSHVAFL